MGESPWKFESSRPHQIFFPDIRTWPSGTLLSESGAVLRNSRVGCGSSAGEPLHERLCLPTGRKVILQQRPPTDPRGLASIDDRFDNPRAQQR